MSFQTSSKFCATNPQLPYFADLSALTEAFLTEMKSQVTVIKQTLAAHPDTIVAQVGDAFPDLTFYPEEDIDGEVEDVEVQTVTLSKTRVIALEDEHCTIAFEANVDFTAFVEYGDPDTMIIDSSEDIRMPLFMRAGTVADTATISGSITLEFDTDWKSILSAFDLELQKQAITIATRPPIRHDEFDDDPAETFEGFPDLPTLHDPPAPPSESSPKPPQ